MSYLILIDEEKHDGQNFQHEDEQEEDEELWRHKGRSHLIPRLSICRGRTTRAEIASTRLRGAGHLIKGHVRTKLKKWPQSVEED